MTQEKTLTQASPAARRDGWQATSVTAGLAGSVIASFCCLPAATAIALGLGLSTAAALSQLVAFQRYFQVVGLAVAVVAAWWIVRRARNACSLPEQQHRRGRVPLYVLGAFALGFAILNIGIIPLLEQLPWLLARR